MRLRSRYATSLHIANERMVRLSHHLLLGRASLSRIFEMSPFVFRSPDVVLPKVGLLCNLCPGRTCSPSSCPQVSCRQFGPTDVRTPRILHIQDSNSNRGTPSLELRTRLLVERGDGCLIGVRSYPTIGRALDLGFVVRSYGDYRCY